jgi:hypothetical protein
MSAPKTVTLIDPTGVECNVSHPAEITNLVYGAGYTVKGGKTPEAAIESLSAQAEAAPAVPAEKPSKA